MTVIGPKFAELGCVLGRECILTVEGQGMGQGPGYVSGVLRITPYPNAPCEEVAPNIVGTGVANVSEIIVTDSIVGPFGEGTLLYSLGAIVEALPRMYGACWKADTMW